jgi:uncharacterized protein YbjT (DUF2867 family)
MSERKVVLVTGATGNQGGAVARALLGHGHRVLALTRRPQSEAARRLACAGAQLVAGDFEDAAALRGALAGADGPVDGVFVVSTPFEAGPQAEVWQGIAVLEAAAAAGAGHVVYSSVASADRRTGVPHFDSKFRVEERLRSLEVSWTILGPVSFLDGFASGRTRRSVAEGKFMFPMDGAKTLQVVVLDDLGLLAALVFEQLGRLRGRRIEVASDELGPARMAAILAEVTGRPVVHVAPDLTDVGVDAGGSDIAVMMRWLAEAGYQADLAGLHAEFPEIGWHSFEARAKTAPWAAPGRQGGN